MSRNAWVVLLCGLAILAGPDGAAAQSGVSIKVTAESLGDADRPGGPFTFGMIFARGDAPGTVTVEGLATQAEIKRRWPDGSVKHAVLTVALPMLPAGERRALVVKPVAAAVPADETGRIDLAEAVKALADVEVRCAIHNGPVRSMSLKRAMQAGPAHLVWLNGPLVVEGHYRAAPQDEKGQADPDLEVRFAVRYYPTVKSARVAVVVENCHWTAPGNIPYDVQILQAGQEVYARKDVGRFDRDGNNQLLKTPEEYIGHPVAARWVKRFWLARPLDDVHVRYDLTYWNRTGLLPKYDPALTVPPETLRKTVAAWEASSREILQNGRILPYFGATGGREDIGPLPTWTARYVLSQDPGALRVVLGNGDLSGSCPVHHRDVKTDWTISIDEHPKFSLNLAGTGERVKPRDASDSPYVLPARSRISVDSAHQPSLGYVPYLVTGDHYYLEEMQFWANWNMLINNYAYRQQERALLTCSLQPRGVAWALRQLVHAAALSPDAGPGKAYFEAKLASNLQYHNDFLAGKLDFKPVAIGTYPPAAGAAYGSTPEMRDRYRTTAGWMHNFLAWALAHAVEQGYTDATGPRDYFARLCTGAFTHPDEITPFAGTAYFLPLAEKGEDGKIRCYQSWKEVAAGMAAMGVPPPKAVSYPGYGGSYSYIARGVLIEAVRAGQAGAADALKWLEGQLPDMPKVLADDPTWAFLPADGR